jgi:zinc transport system permease protein
MDFLHLIFEETFMGHAVLGMMIASVCCAFVGPFVHVKKLGSMAGGISHSMLAGMGIAAFFEWDPYWGAAVAAVVSALSIRWIIDRKIQSEDTAINALWAIGMAIGLMFLSKAPGYGIDMNAYLFGSILLIPEEQLLWSVGVTTAVVTFIQVFKKQLLAISLDENFAQIRGVRVRGLNAAFAVVLALTIVVLMRLAGILLLIALLVLPPATARRFSHSMTGMVGISAVVSMFSGLAGLFLAHTFDLPAGASIIMVAGLIFIASNARRNSV